MATTRETRRTPGLVGSIPKTAYVVFAGIVFVVLGVALDIFGTDLIAGLSGALGVIIVALGVFMQVLIVVLGRFD